MPNTIEYKSIYAEYQRFKIILTFVFISVLKAFRHEKATFLPFFAEREDALPYRFCRKTRLFRSLISLPKKPFRNSFHGRFLLKKMNMELKNALPLQTDTPLKTLFQAKILPIEGIFSIRKRNKTNLQRTFFVGKQAATEERKQAKRTNVHKSSVAHSARILQTFAWKRNAKLCPFARIPGTGRTTTKHLYTQYRCLVIC